MNRRKPRTVVYPDRIGEFRPLVEVTSPAALGGLIGKPVLLPDEPRISTFSQPAPDRPYLRDQAIDAASQPPSMAPELITWIEQVQAALNGRVP